MLKGIDPIISPELLKILCEMGHGDELVIADSNYPSESMGKRVIRYDGIKCCEILQAILKLIPLDDYVDDNFILMNTNDNSYPPIWNEYKKIAFEENNFKNLSFLEREKFYERSKNAYCIIASGETETYANIIIKKGVIIYK